MKKRLKVNGIIMGFAGLAIIFYPRFFLRTYSGSIQEEILEALGFALILLGQIIRVSARGYKAEHSKNSHALIEGGLYQIVRNPMYLGIILIGLGVVLMFFNWWVVFLFLLIFASRYFPLIFSEEKKLQNAFGEIYDAYCRRVPRIMPRLASLISTSVKVYLPIKPAWFKKERNSIIPLLILILLFFLWRR
ncbi:MAG: methyltransferase family protein [Candidatus Omnitrophota bacterium]